jgi:hypothetical protein
LDPSSNIYLRSIKSALLTALAVKSLSAWCHNRTA